MKKTIIKFTQTRKLLTFVITTFILLMKINNCYADDTLPKSQFEIDYEKEQTRMKIICATVSDVDFPREDMPSKADRTSLADCQSDRFYYGMGIPVNFIKARKCAFIEREKTDNYVFSGSSILMMLYANGQGVKRNLDLAIKLACSLEETVPERIDHLVAMKTDPKPKRFDACDEVADDNMSGACTGEDYDTAQSKRDQQLTLLSKKWPAKDQIAFNILRQVANDFFNTHANNETDLSGSARAAMTYDEQNLVQEDFFLSIEEFETNGIPFYSDEDDQQADAKLNKIYHSIMKKSDAQFEGTTLNKADIKETQRTWLVYRDAWLAFAAIHYPQASAASLRTWLTRQRIEQLE